MRFPLKPWLAVAVVTFVVAIVNATSHLMEMSRDGGSLGDMSPAAPFLWELSSFALNVALAPFIGEAIRRVPPARERLPAFLAIHAAGTLAYSAIHVAGMVSIRKAGYALVGSFYNFSHGNLPREFFYEWRKDVIGYAILASIYWYFQNRAAPGPALSPAPDARVEIRDGAAAVFLPPSDILWVEAAGNYVEFHTASRTHLVRGTLAAWEGKLTPHGFVRAHRSRLINRARVRTLKPTPAGDLEIELDDGRSVAGSRRYRAGFDAAPTA